MLAMLCVTVAEETYQRRFSLEKLTLSKGSTYVVSLVGLIKVNARDARICQNAQSCTMHELLSVEVKMKPTTDVTPMSSDA